MSKYFTMKDNSKEFIEAKNVQTKAALEAIGTQAVSHVTQNITRNGRVDTGLYRNSITYALSGEKPKKDAYSGNAGMKTGKPGSKGTYSGTAPEDPENKPAIYVGSNVDYALYVEEGTRKQAGTHDIKNGIADNINEYKEIYKKILKNGQN